MATRLRSHQKSADKVLYKQLKLPLSNLQRIYRGNVLLIAAMPSQMFSFAFWRVLPSSFLRLSLPHSSQSVDWLPLELPQVRR